MAEFTYNNAKNISSGHTLFKFNYDYYSKVLFKEDVNPCSRFCSTKKLAEKLRKLINICYQNLFYVQKLQKRAYSKKIKSFSYILCKKVWLNSKYIKIKKNKKHKSKFFGPFWVFHVVRKQAYKLELYTK